MATISVDPLDRRIIGALQADGRAAWRSIAAALQASERTVTRRGTAMLNEGIVRVSGIAPRGDSVVVRVRCVPGSSQITARALAVREHTTFAYLTTGAADCIAEVIAPPDAGSQFLLEELPSVPGVVSMTTSPVLRYFRTIHEWQPNLITKEEKAALDAISPPTTPARQLDRPSTDAQDRALIAALRQNGRSTFEELGRMAGVSEATARRRVESLRKTGQVYIRAVVDPAILGYPTRVVLSVRTPAARTAATAEALTASPYVRYAAALMGKDQIIADLAMPSMQSVYDFVTSAPWAEHATSVETSLIVRVAKTSGVVVS